MARQGSRLAVCSEIGTLKHCCNTRRIWRLTLFVDGCYSREVPIGRGFFVIRPTAGIVEAHSPGWAHHNQTTHPAVRYAGPASDHQRGIILFDETITHNPESPSAVATETEPTMEPQQPEQNQFAEMQESDAAEASSAAEDKAAPAEDFASALETF